MPTLCCYSSQSSSPVLQSDTAPSSRLTEIKCRGHGPGRWLMAEAQGGSRSQLEYCNNLAMIFKKRHSSSSPLLSHCKPSVRTPAAFMKQTIQAPSPKEGSELWMAKQQGMATPGRATVKAILSLQPLLQLPWAAQSTDHYEFLAEVPSFLALARREPRYSSQGYALYGFTHRSQVSQKAASAVKM